MGNYIPSTTSKHSQSQEEAKLENFTCEICIEPVLRHNTSFNIGGNCVHPLCTDCIIKYIQAKLEDEIAEIRCPALNCTRFLDPLECKGLIGPELFKRWCDLLCLMALSGYSRSYCPNMNCLALIVDECDTNVKEVVCPKCKDNFCFQCKVPWHAGFRCEEIGDENDRAFRALAKEENWKSCPRCHLFIEKYEGCKNIKCRCGTHFCHNCGQELQNCRCMLRGDAFRRFSQYFVYFGVLLCALAIIRFVFVYSLDILM